MDAAYAVDGILDFEPPAGDLAPDSRETEAAAPSEAGFGPGQGDATVLAWARAM